MKHFVTILFLLLLSSATFAEYSERHVKVRYPEFVPMNSNISFSYIFSGNSLDSDSATVTILPNEEIDISDIILNSSTLHKKIKFETIEDESHWTKYYRFTLDDSVTFSLKAFQVVVNLKNINTGQLYIDSRITCYPGISDPVTYSSEYDEYSNNHINPIIISPFKVQSVAGQAISLPSGSGFEFTQEQLTTENDLMIEFWAKFVNYQNDFLTIRNIQADTMLSVGINSYNLIKIPSYSEPGTLEDYFISDSAWYHFNLILRYEEFIADVYVNDNMVFSVPVNNLIADDKFELIISNSSDDENSTIDLEGMKIWDFNNSLQTSFINKNYRSYFLDSSRVLSDFTFDRMMNDTRLNKSAEFEKNYKIVISDAPVFSKAPELNVTGMATFYNIEWVNRDPNNAVSFVLEKSTDGISFYNVHRIDANDQEENTYYYTDSRSPEDDVLYYRIKQENRDGTTVYSSQVKIGQGNIELFSINQNYPNPFNPVTTITLEMFEDSEVEITVFDIMGKKVEKLHTGFLTKGMHTFNFDGSELPSGIYLYEVKSMFSSVVQKMILTK